MKRSISDSDDSDCDVFDDRLKSGSPSQSCQITDRKKRRGIIEKRRRDRINCSLTELRRLVPSAFEKQGSAKLEKAEILQMTVDHLKLLHQKGVSGYNCDPHTVALDYRYVGFRECAAEVARYLVAVEGMDLQDPLRMRLLSHLQCYSAQREAAAKASLQAAASVPPSVAAWPPAPHAVPAVHAVPGVPAFNSQYSAMPGGGQGASSSSSVIAHQPPSSSDVMAPHHGVTSSTSVLNAFANEARHLGGVVGGDGVGGGVGGVGAGLGGLHPHHHHPHHPHPAAASRGHHGPAAAMTATSSTASGSAGPQPSLSPPLLHSLPQFHASQFPPQSMMTAPPPPSVSHPGYTHSHSGQSLQHSAGVKPYRPWGGELAY